ncbi:MAG: histidine kinase dimerization/phospho-acceptor domain-containing protein, partial [Myxococcota bacterium]
MSEGDAPDSRWERRFHRERRARKEAERLLQDKSRELYDANIQLKTLLRTLEQRVEDRTREADAARRKAEAASEAKTRFLATMSHEIRTPMNGVVGMADFLSTTPLNTEQRASVDTIQTASSTLRRLLDDILDFSRLESGKLELSPTEFSVQNLIRDLIALHRPTAERRGLLIHSEVDPTMPAAVIGDRLRIGQVMGNLINNAIKFTETGSIRIRARWRASALHVSVIDTGIGIPEASREHLFQRFA